MEVDMNVIKDMLTGRSILIIGAALSFGSEMARQVATFKPTEFVTTRFGNVFGSKASVNTTFLLWQGSLLAERNIQHSTLRTAHRLLFLSILTHPKLLCVFMALPLSISMMSKSMRRK